MIKESEAGKNPEYSYFMPVEIVFGRGCREKLASNHLVQSSEKLLIIAGGHLKRDGTVDGLVSQFGKRPSVYNPKISKSDIDTIDALTSFCRTEKPDLIIAIGGGTVLDTAKSAAILVNNPGSVSKYVVTEKKVINSTGIPLVAIPTTAGTGSEVTPWATVWDLENKKKYSLVSPLMFSKSALVDSELTDNLPPEITASTGIDALVQAIEAYWSKNHNPISDIFALKAIELILASLEKTVNNPDVELREAMTQGSLFSGLAFSNTETTICHAVSYPMTAHWNITHGQAVAITLPSFIKYSLPVLKERKAPLLKALGAEDEKEAAVKISSLMEKIGLATKLSQLGIREENIDLIVKEGFHPDRAGNAPRVPSPKELQRMLEEIL